VVIRSAEFIGWALGGLEKEIAETRARLAELTAEAARLRTRVGGRGADAAVTAEADGTGKPRRRRRLRMSAEARKRLSDATKRRWAERKKKGMNKL
jgi:hypothetical protein